MSKAADSHSVKKTVDHVHKSRILIRLLPNVTYSNEGSYLSHVNNSGDISSIHHIRFQDPCTGQNFPSHHVFTRVRHGCIVHRLNSQDRQVLLHERKRKEENFNFLKHAVLFCLP